MLDLTDTVSLLEVLWTAVCFTAFCISLKRVGDAVIDNRAAQNERAVIIAKRNMRGDAGRAVRLLVYAGIGVRAMTIPTPAGGGGSWVSALVAIGFVGLAIFDFIDSTLSVREQARLLDLATSRVRRSRMYAGKEDA